MKQLATYDLLGFAGIWSSTGQKSLSYRLTFMSQDIG